MELPSIKEILKKNNIKIHKSLGQNFIFDQNLTDKIVSKAQPLTNTIIEIGPGPGGLTRSILKQNPTKLFVIDIDTQSEKMLSELKLMHTKTLSIIIEDALKYPIWELGDSPRQIIANLPYNSATKMLITWLQHVNDFQSLTLMFQKEVADRILAKPGSKSYGRLSVITNWLSETTKLFDVPNSAFIPKPKVNSTVIKIKPYKKPLHDVSFSSLEKITKIIFNQRRKMIKTSLKELDGCNILSELKISPLLRPEQLSIEDFCRIAKKVFEN